MTHHRLFIPMCLVVWLLLVAVPAAFAIGGLDELSTALVGLKTTVRNYIP